MLQPRLTKINQHYYKALQIAGVILVCVLAFLHALFFAENFEKYGSYHSPDAQHYIAMAQRLLEEGIYSFWGNGPDAYVSPGYPLFLTACMAIFGTDVYALHSIKIIQAILVALTVFLTFCLGYLLTKKYSIGLFASFMIAINGWYGFVSRQLLTESLYYFSMLLAVTVFLIAVQSQKKWVFFLAGVCFCASIMVRPLLIIVIPFIFFPLLLRLRKKALIPLALFVVGFVLVGLPWWIRNIVVLHQPILLATQTNPIYAGLAKDVIAIGLKDPGTMLGNLKLLLQLLISDFTGTVYWMTFGKFNIMFMSTIKTYIGLEILTNISAFLVIFPGLLGAFIALFDKSMRWASIVFWVFFASSFMFIPTSRYGMQYLFFLAIFTGYLIHLASTNVRKKQLQ